MQPKTSIHLKPRYSSRSVFKCFCVFVFLCFCLNLLLLPLTATAKDKDDFFIQPEVVNTYPLNEAQDVPLDAEIFISFNIQMAKWSVEENLTVSPLVSGKIDWYCGWQLTLKPVEPLLCGTTYNVRLDGRAVSKTSFSLGEDYVYSFITQECAADENEDGEDTVLDLNKIGPDSAEVGDEIEYQINWSARGEHISGLQVEDILPNELDLISASEDYIYSTSTHSVLWQLGDFTNLAQGSLSLSAQVNQATTGTSTTDIINQVIIQAGSQSLVAYATTTLLINITEQEPPKPVQGPCAIKVCKYEDMDGLASTTDDQILSDNMWTFALISMDSPITNVIATTTDGCLIFSDLEPGEYQIKEELLPDWTPLWPGLATTTQVYSESRQQINFINYFESGQGGAAPLLEISKELANTQDSFYLNDELKFMISLTNTGQTVIKTLPLVDIFNNDYLSFVFATPSPDYAATSSLSWNDLTSVFGNLGLGQKISFEVIYKVSSSTQITLSNLSRVENAVDELGSLVPKAEDEVEFKINAAQNDSGTGGNDSGSSGSSGGGCGSCGSGPSLTANLTWLPEYEPQKRLAQVYQEKITLTNTGQIEFSQGELLINLPEDKLKFYDSPQSRLFYDDFNQRIIWGLPDLKVGSSTQIVFEVETVGLGQAVSLVNINYDQINSTGQLPAEISQAIKVGEVGEVKEVREVGEVGEVRQVRGEIVSPVIAGDYEMAEEMDKGATEEAQDMPLVIPHVYTQKAEPGADCPTWLWWVIILLHLIILIAFYVYLLPEKLVDMGDGGDKGSEEDKGDVGDERIRIVKGSFKWLLPVAVGLGIIFLLLVLVCKFNWQAASLILLSYYLTLFFYYLLLRQQSGKIKKVWPALFITALPVFVYLWTKSWSVWIWVWVIIFYALTIFFYYLSLIKLKQLRWWGWTVFCLTVLVLVLEMAGEC